MPWNNQRLAKGTEMILKALTMTLIPLYLIAGVFADTPNSNDIMPKDYFFKITLSRDNAILTIVGKDSLVTAILDNRSVKKADEEVTIDGMKFLSRKGFYIDGNLYPLDSINRVRLEIGTDDKSEIFFLRAPAVSETRFRAHRQNVISVLDDISIGGDRFVRGSVVSLWSNIQIHGEVNEDVIAIFGNITAGDSAVIRGNMAAINGTIDVSQKATVYGSIQSPAKKNRYRLDRWKRWYRRDRYLSPIAIFHYNRVDGATPYFGMRFLDEDSLLPEINVYAGYAFASKRWRVHMGIEKTFFKTTPLTIGGSYYRKLATNDEWIVSEDENTAFALLATEDFMDYYEAEGGRGFARMRFFNMLNVETGILAENYKWLDAHRDLWSLFGGQKRFPENFSTVYEPYRGVGIQEIANKDITSSVTKIQFETHKLDEIFTSSYWEGWSELEIAPKSWNSHFDFTRFMISMSRYQGFSGQSGLMARLVYAGSSGYLPLERKYFLGGLGTLQGYYHKEFMGRRFWFGELEYGIRVPHSDLIGWAYYEVGQIASDTVRLADAEMKHSIGIGISFGEDIRLNVARRLDRTNASPKIYVRLERLF